MASELSGEAEEAATLASDPLEATSEVAGEMDSTMETVSSME